MAELKVAVIGSGIVGEALANGFIKHGYQVMRASRTPEKLREWKSKTGGKASTGDFEEATQYCTNPISDEPPVKGVLNFFTERNESLMERLQRSAPQVNFVKAFSCVGAAFMVNPIFGKEKPTMFICGNNDGAKSQVREILTQFGWETEDMGPVEAARAIEPLCILWCLPGFTKNEWSHAFRFLKMSG